MKNLFILLLLSLSSLALAQSPLERAAKIKEWRANCSDPDPDLRLAYLEAAIATKDQTVARACMKQAMVSDDPDVKNLALRTAIASAGRLTIQFSLPEEYLKELEKAKKDDDEEKAANINKKYAITRAIYKHTSGLIGIVAKDVDVQKQASHWHTFAINSIEDKKFMAQFSLVGNTFSGEGTAALYGKQIYNFNIALELNNNGELVGYGTIKGYGAGGVRSSTVKMPVKIKVY